MPAQDFVFLVTLDALGADIPRDHPSFRVQREDSVILHTVDQQAKTFFALLAILFCPPALSDVRDDATDQVYFPAGVEHRKLLDHARVRAVGLQSHLLEFHRTACSEHLKIIGLKYGGLLGGKYRFIPLTYNLFSGDTQ